MSRDTAANIANYPNLKQIIRQSTNYRFKTPKRSYNNAVNDILIPKSPLRKPYITPTNEQMDASINEYADLYSNRKLHDKRTNLSDSKSIDTEKEYIDE